jgi:hypothetical protein
MAVSATTCNSDVCVIVRTFQLNGHRFFRYQMENSRLEAHHIVDDMRYIDSRFPCESMVHRYNYIELCFVPVNIPFYTQRESITMINDIVNSIHMVLDSTLIWTYNLARCVTNLRIV